MFKEFEDYVVAAAALYCAVVVGKEAVKAYEELAEIKAESSSEWDKLTLDRYKMVSDKLDQHRATPMARIEAFEHAHMLLEKHIAFYAVNAVAREKALAFNDRHFKDLKFLWS